MKSLLESAQSAASAMVQQISDLVRLETHSYDVSALRQCAEHLKELTVGHLGDPADWEILDGGEQGPTVKATYPGTGSGRVLVIAHYDTVWPTGTLADWGIREATDAEGSATLSGPGIFDMKTGLVQGLWALKLLRESGAATPTVTYLFNGDEEIGSLSSRPHIEAAARQADAVLVLEPTSGGAVKTGRKGIGIFRMTATGIEAHAGLNPTAGASAIHAIAEAITAATGIADLTRGTSINVGLVQGGSGTNVSAGNATAAVDIRVENSAEMARVDAAFDALTISDDRVRLDIEHNWNRPPMAMGEPGERLFGLVRTAAAEFGHDLQGISVGGGSDANFVAALGIPVLCGMGAVGDGAHARNEFIYPEAIPLYTAIAAKTLGLLADGWAGAAAD